MLWHWEDLPEKPMRRAYESFAWSADCAALAAWQRGATGYPLIDAAMRELRATGYLQQYAPPAAGNG